ncbi:MAG: aspartate-semialdehyde dehydrogenase [Bacteroidetes bacterium HGW-Bacteroidetes-17]|nr:MAG: aspartate-semialdehyde dehydrogenase [Bacteroidetes bacterium HGW-Bacteroidetes-17]
MKIAVVGATGLVGRKILEVINERDIQFTELIPVASEKSVGKKISFKGKDWTVVSLQNAVDQKPDVALFSAGGETSLKWAEAFAANGTFVIDNSSAWRMHPDKKLVVPEINAGELTINDKIIANPNCSTIQMVLALAPLHKKYKIKRVVVSTYQSITGSGILAVNQLENERNGIDGPKKYPHVIDKNCIPQCDDFSDGDYTKEELKLVNETKKILGDNSIQVTATAVRVPLVGGHSESINVEFEHEYELADIRPLLEKEEGIIVLDDVKNSVYPMPINAHEKDEVFVGRIRRDFSQPKSLNLWIVSDNLRKGAATNAVQIMEYLIKNNFIG